jgi:hypothetical protein
MLKWLIRALPVSVGDRMRRREFISLLSSAAFARPRAVIAQDSVKRPLVAVLVAASSTAAARYVSGFLQGLQELGYVEGRSIDIVYPYDAALPIGASLFARLVEKKLPRLSGH